MLTYHHPHVPVTYPRFQAGVGNLCCPKNSDRYVGPSAIPRKFPATTGYWTVMAGLAKSTTTPLTWLHHQSPRSHSPDQARPVYQWLYRDTDSDAACRHTTTHLYEWLKLVHSQSKFRHGWLEQFSQVVRVHDLHQNSKCFLFRHLQQLQMRKIILIN